MPQPRPLFRLTFVAALALLLVPSAGRAGEKGPLTVDDVVAMAQVYDVALSHDGTLAAFVRDEPRSADQPNGPAWRRLYVQPTAGGPARPFVAGDGRVGSPHFSPRDGFLGFIAKRDGQEFSQVWAIPTNGGEARPVTDHPAGVESFVWLADGRVAYVAAAKTSKRVQALRDKDYAPRFYEEELEERAVWVASFDFGGTPATATRLTTGMSVWQLSAPASGTTLVLGASPRPLVDESYVMQDVFIVDLAELGKAGKPLVPRRVADPPGKLGGVSVSPDGTLVAYTAAASRSDHAPSRVYVVPIGGGAARDLTVPDFAGHVFEVTWWDARTILYLSYESVWSTWRRVGVDAPPAANELVHHARDTGVVARFPVVQPGASVVVARAATPAHPHELYVWRRDGADPPRRLTDSNPWLAERSLGAQEVVSYEARDGLRIEGILIRPVGPTRGRPPLIVDAHGGPEAHRTHDWLTNYFHPGQIAAGRGYAVFYPNYRGSTGRGVAFAARAYGDPAGAEFDDMADGIRWLTRPDGGVADPKRVGLVGGSYGGYAANWFATRYTELVRAVVSFVGVSDLVAKRLLTDIPLEDLYVHMGKPVHESWELMLERSPIRWAPQSRTAVLLLHGDADPRVHPSQSQEMYRALKRAGHPATRLVFYPGEGHGNRKRSYRLDASVRTLGWLDWYVRDGKAFGGPMPPRDLGDHYGLDLPE